MKIGIVGLPYVGKTSIFNALTQSNVETGTYIVKKRTNMSSVKVPDERLQSLEPIFKPKKVTYTTIDYVDVAGVSKGEAERSGLEVGFIAELRDVDALAHVVRLFQDESVPHVDGEVNPIRDIETIDFEFALADLQIIEKRLERIIRELRVRKDPELGDERIVLERCKTSLEDGIALREINLSPEDEKMIRGYRFLTQKPLLLVCNIGEDQLDTSADITKGFLEYSHKPNTELIALSAKLEMEISQLDEEDARIFLVEMGLSESALARFIQTSYRLLGVMTFFTGGPSEVRAWILRQGQTAVEAAGTIHSDLARGFIRAETIHWSELANSGSVAKAREKGLLRLEGKEYIVQDGEVLTIRFNV